LESKYSKVKLAIATTQLSKLINFYSINFRNLRKTCVGTYTEDNITIKREWVIPFNNFDNILWSMITFFELATLEGWPTILLRVIDSQGVDMGPKEDNRIYAALLFISFIFIQTFFVMNLFVSVIVDKFNEEIKRRQGASTFTEE
jgi:hypothetical protein